MRARDRHIRSLAIGMDYFGGEVADRYDDGGPMFSPEVLGPTIDFLAALAGHGAALEFGIGTGRVALPLAQRGVRVHGIDLSEAMVAKLRQKPNAEQVANQGLVSHHLWPEGGVWRKRSIPFRYVWPTELDLMARVAGMRLRER